MYTNTELMCFDRAETKVVEPQGMNPGEVFDWYLEQSSAFQRRHLNRIRQLGQGLIETAIVEAGELVESARVRRY